MKPGAEWQQKKSVRIFASILLAFFFLYRAVDFYLKAFHGFAWDYSINWTAALGLLEGLSVYDRQALQQLAVLHIDHGMQTLFTGRFTSFIGLPTTAILHIPFTMLSFEISVQVYRILSLVAMCLSIIVTGLAVPRSMRGRAWLVGLACLLCWNAFSFSLRLGQVDAWVLLCLAVSVLAVSRRWHLAAGVAMGVAALLKISPGWLLLYGLIKRQWLVVVGAAVSLLLGLALSAFPRRGLELVEFFTAVLPVLGDSPLHIQNQSLGAFLARLTTDDVQLTTFIAGTGHWKSVGVIASALLLFSLYRRTDKGAVTAHELAAIIPVALLAGPLTWDHYLCWAVIPVMLLATRVSIRGLCCLAVLLLPLAFPVVYPGAGAIAEHAWYRTFTGLQSISMIFLSLWMILVSGQKGLGQKTGDVI